MSTGNTVRKESTVCESCLMPFSKDTGIRESEKYCSLCFRDGRLCYEGDDLKEFQKVMYASMRAHGSTVLFAALATWMARFALRWRK